MNTTSIGKNAEELVAEYLRNNKHNIIQMNWKTRWCEIDIVSVKNKTVYFIEVKYRSKDTWGDGFSYITSKKLSQMNFAAENWMHKNAWQYDAQLLAAAVDSYGNVSLVEI